jgi:hypothetical protein
MAKRRKKRHGKKAGKQPSEMEATEVRVGAGNPAIVISATALAAFTRDVAAFGCRRDRRPTQPAD